MVSHKITLGSRHFKSKKDAKEYIREILDRNIGQTLKGEDLEVVLALLESHPNYDDKVGFGVKSVYVKGSKSNHCFYLKYIDGSEDGHFSYEKCLYGSREKLVSQRRQKAYRMAVQSQIDEYKRQHRNEKCAECGCSAQGNYHVDHFDPQFARLILDFERRHSHLPTEFDEGLGNTKIFREGDSEDAKFAQEWRDYHRRNAKLRILCANCNFRRKRK